MLTIRIFSGTQRRHRAPKRVEVLIETSRSRSDPAPWTFRARYDPACHREFRGLKAICKQSGELAEETILVAALHCARVR
jgi:hypothetical protein